jgi:thioredoxin 1
LEKPIDIDDKAFDDKVLKASVPVLVDFWAPRCGPCRAVAPILDELAKEYKGRVTFARLNVDESTQNASKYGISAIPTLLVFKEGKPISQIVGFRPKAELKKALDEAIT